MNKLVAFVASHCEKAVKVSENDEGWLIGFWDLGIWGGQGLGC